MYSFKGGEKNLQYYTIAVYLHRRIYCNIKHKILLCPSCRSPSRSWNPIKPRLVLNLVSVVIRCTKEFNVNSMKKRKFGRDRLKRKSYAIRPRSSTISILYLYLSGNSKGLPCLFIYIYTLWISNYYEIDILPSLWKWHFLLPSVFWKNIYIELKKHKIGIFSFLQI